MDEGGAVEVRGEGEEPEGGDGVDGIVRCGHFDFWGYGGQGGSLWDWVVALMMYEGGLKEKTEGQDP